MNTKNLYDRFDLQRGDHKCNGENEIKRSLDRSLKFFIALVFLLATSVNAIAGGLVDTSLDRFLAADFTTNPSEEITNPWWTLTAGKNFLYFAEDGGDCVWNLTEVLEDTANGFLGDYSGITARVVLDRGWVDEDCVHGEDFQAFMATDPEPEESTYDWYAQDWEKNIWYMGENTFDGDFGGSFVAGCDGAEPGIVILGSPGRGDFYSQEFYADEAEDWGKVLNFKNIDGLVCMTTKEWTPLERGAIEHKWYCSDGITGKLSRIEELHGKTVLVQLVAEDIDPPPAVGLPINPDPSCP